MKILFLISLFSIATGELLRIDIGNNIAFRLLDILVFICFLFFLIRCIRNKSFPGSDLRKPVLIFASVGLLSLVINIFSLTTDQLLVSGLYLFRWIMYACTFFIILTFDKQYREFIKKVLFIVGVLIVAAGYLQYFLYPNLRNLFYQGWDEHNYRMFSVFLDPNFAGCFFVLFFNYVAYLFYRDFKIKKMNTAVAYFTALIITFIAIFLTYSRSAILMLVISSIAYAILVGRKKLVFYFFAFTFVILLILSPTFNKENTNLLRVTSSIARIESYANALKIIHDNPLFGVGFNAYRYAQQSYGFKEEETEFPNHADAGVDNSFLFVLATTGIFGLIAYLSIWYKIFKKAFEKIRKPDNAYAVFLLSSSLGLFFNSFFINSLFFPVIMFWIWIHFGLLDKD